MGKLVAKCWNDDDGAVLAIEWLFLVTILAIGMVTGLVSVRNAVTAELNETGQAISTLGQGYAFTPIFGCTSWSQGSAAFDQPTDTGELIHSIPPFANNQFIVDDPCN